MIRPITLITCDWCGHAEQVDGAGPPAIHAAYAAGWIMRDGKDYCGPICRDKDPPAPRVAA
jgi:hypothetical protein